MCEELWREWMANVDGALIALLSGENSKSFTYDWRAAFERGVSAEDACKIAIMEAGVSDFTEEDLNFILKGDVSDTVEYECEVPENWL